MCAAGARFDAFSVVNVLLFVVYPQCHAGSPPTKTPPCQSLCNAIFTAYAVFLALALFRDFVCPHLCVCFVRLQLHLQAADHHPSGQHHRHQLRELRDHQLLCARCLVSAQTAASTMRDVQRSACCSLFFFCAFVAAVCVLVCFGVVLICTCVQARCAAAWSTTPFMCLITTRKPTSKRYTRVVACLLVAWLKPCVFLVCVCRKRPLLASPSTWLRWPVRATIGSKSTSVRASSTSTCTDQRLLFVLCVVHYALVRCRCVGNALSVGAAGVSVQLPSAFPMLPCRR